LLLFSKVTVMISYAWTIVLSLLIGMMSILGLTKPAQKDSTGNKKSETGFAVVELFTSQGCSSCPPADRVLAELADSIDDQQQVYLLSFHVDYWNQLGWNDPYSLAASTDRQKAYARAWSSRRVYTPQMVVNGTWEFNGGNERKARRSISESLSQPARSSIRLSTRVSNDTTSAVVSYEIEGEAEDHLLNLALVSPEQINEVPRGENRGRKLRHVNVVRAFRSQRLEGNAGRVEFTIPDGFNVESGTVVAYLQDPDDAVLTGAIAQSLGNQ
jgi:hypothetical protein